MNDYREITKLKNNIATKSILKILGYTFVVILIFSLIVDGFYNDTIANEVSSFNRSLYLFFVRNKTIMMVIFYMIIFIGITFIVTRNMSQKMLEIMKSVDKIIKEPDKEIKLSNDLILLENKLNKIRLDLINSQNAAREAENKKNDLIMYMAHDLKTPLTSVIGYLNLLTDEKDISKQSQEKYIKIALEKSYRLEELINELFDVARFNSEKIILEKEKLDLNLMIEQIIDDFYPTLKEMNKKIEYTHSGNLTIEADSDKLSRVFNNLLKNAINYSSDGTDITVKSFKKNNEVIVEVTNKGKQIPKEKLDRIFEKFYRLDCARTSKTGGSGLGLAIAKEIVELHNGTIKAVSNKEETKFIVTLPIE